MKLLKAPPARPPCPVGAVFPCFLKISLLSCLLKPFFWELYPSILHDCSIVMPLGKGRCQACPERLDQKPAPPHGLYGRIKARKGPRRSVPGDRATAHFYELVLGLLTQRVTHDGLWESRVGLGVRGSIARHRKKPFIVAMSTKNALIGGF